MITIRLPEAAARVTRDALALPAGKGFHGLVDVLYGQQSQLRQFSAGQVLHGALAGHFSTGMHSAG